MKRRIWGKQPIRVYRADGTWQWHCHMPMCTESGWTCKQGDSLAMGLAHLAKHNLFGFRRP